MLHLYIKNIIIKCIAIILTIILCINTSANGLVRSNNSFDIPQQNYLSYIDYGKSAFSYNDRKSTEPFEIYSDLDELGRCGVAFANICKELMPTKEREPIWQIKPSGWQTPLSKYDFIDGKFLYNRCHLIAFVLYLHFPP